MAAQGELAEIAAFIVFESDESLNGHKPRTGLHFWKAFDHMR